MKIKIQPLLQIFSSFIFKPYCCLCGKMEGDTLCQSCQNYLPIAKVYCLSCGINIEQGTQESDLYCGSCCSGPKPYRHTISCFWYEEPVQTLIQDYKFRQKLFLTPILGKLMLQQIKHYYSQYQLTYPDFLIPMPIHPKRLRERGYHQVYELTKILSQKLLIPIHRQASQRIQHSSPQSTIPFKERKKNVKNAFQSKKIACSHIAIIDDVITTGETVSALCHTLIRENPGLIIDVWCLARTRAKNL